MCATLEKVTLWRQKSEHCFWVQIIHLKKKWWKNKQFEKSDTSKTICYFFGKNIIFVFFFFCKNQFTHCVLCIFVYNVFHGAEMTGATNAVGKKTVFHSWDKREKTWADFITAMRIWIHFQHCQCFLFFRKVRQTWLQKSDMHSINSISVCICVCVCKTH